MKHLVTSFIVGFTPFATQAAFVQINQPDAGYLASTTKIQITQPNGTDMVSITDGALVVFFTHVREVHELGNGWATWSSPPNSESATPRVLTADGYNDSLNSLTMTFSTAVSLFGFELEGDPHDERTFTADFYNGAALVGTVSRAVVGNSGARLFAADATGADQFTSVIVSGNIDFAIAQLRYSLVPEPASTAMLLLGGIVFLGRRSRRNAA